MPLTLEVAERVYIVEKGACGATRRPASSGRTPPWSTSTWACKRPHRPGPDPAVNGLVNGMILALMASGLTLIFGVVDIINFAHGDLVILGGSVGAVTIAQTGSFWLALLVAALTIRMFGACSRRRRFAAPWPRPASDDPGDVRLSLVLQECAIWQWGPSARRIPRP